VPIEKLHRDHEALDSIQLYGSLPSRERAMAAVGDPDRLDEFIERLRSSITGSLGSDGRLHGIRVEAMFRAVVVALGEFRLLTDEDLGDVYFDTAHDPVQPPDYRIVDTAGAQMLVEVKSVPPGGVWSYSMRGSDVESRLRYSALTGAPLYFALYWSGWGLWTLVPAERFKREGAKYQIEMTEAMKANEMARLGDAWVATTPPLTLSLTLQSDESPRSGQTISATITAVNMRAAGVVLDDVLESNLAWILFRYGSWSIEEEQIYDETRNAFEIDYVAQPPDEDARQLAADQGFISIGALSTIYSSMFNEATLATDSRILQLDHELPLGTSGPLIPPDYWDSPHRLPLWRMEVRPAD
jgi:hypothetical protein